MRIGMLLAWMAMLGVQGAAEDRGSSLRRRLVGQWTLAAVEVVSGDRIEYPLGREVSGILGYDEDGRMDVQIMQANRPRFASGDQGNGTPAELAAAIGGYVAYFGTYRVDEEAMVVTHFIEGSLFPNAIGTAQEREIVLDGDTLVLRARPALYQGRLQVFRVIWTRKR